MMPQGTIPRGREFFDPELKGRWGAARLAHESQVPVIPIGLWGTEQRVAPVVEVAQRRPTSPNPPTVTVRDRAAGRARVRLGRGRHGADHGRRSSRLLPPSAREPYEPTDEEIRRALPAGVDEIDADHEAARRPGID